MKGESNHDYLENASFLVKTTIEGYDMYDMGWYPAIIHGDSIIVGELYQVPKEDMASIDMLEGEGLCGLECAESAGRPCRSR